MKSNTAKCEAPGGLYMDGDDSVHDTNDDTTNEMITPVPEYNVRIEGTGVNQSENPEQATLSNAVPPEAGIKGNNIAQSDQQSKFTPDATDKKRDEATISPATDNKSTSKGGNDTPENSTGSNESTNSELTKGDNEEPTSPKVSTSSSDLDIGDTKTRPM